MPGVYQRMSSPAQTMMALVLVGSYVVAASAQAPAPQSGGAALPKRASDVLDKRFKGWRLASVDAAGDSCAATPGGRSASFGTGDLNGDGTTDYVLQIATAGGVRVVALFGSLNGFTLHDVVGPAATNYVIDVRRRGTRFSKVGVVIEDFFGADTVTLTECGKSLTAYVWTGSGFRAVAIQM